MVEAANNRLEGIGDGDTKIINGDREDRGAAVSHVVLATAELAVINDRPR